MGEANRRDDRNVSKPCSSINGIPNQAGNNKVNGLNEHRKANKLLAQGSQEDIAAARSLLQKKHLRHSLFFAHLALEKMLKAFVVRQTNEIPPYIHNLVRLVEIAKLNIGPERLDFLRKFNIFQLEGRYPDYTPGPLDIKIARERLSEAEETLKWLTDQF
ncbi:MAG: HEPN domain-containing protein [Candidatus Hatepunaea meridiana]|nr:HEPN domain-containing protein [Candidatus Hatepunaea meridiana]